MTIREFAKLCGVSPATASRFFSGRGSISESVRLRIEQVAKETGYTPPESFRGRRKTSSLIVVVLPHFCQSFLQDMMEQLRSYAVQTGKQLLILPVNRENPQDMIAFISSCEPMGVILMQEIVDYPLAEALSHRNLPVVVCGGLSAGRRFSAVHIDDMMAAYDGTNYLLQLGHHQIGFLTDASRVMGSGFRRLIGCRKAMEDAHFTLEETYIQSGNMTFHDGYLGIQQLLERHPNITAIFAFNDDLAAGAITRLRELGKKVPEDISVLGFDGSAMAKYLYPALTTVQQPFDQIARKTLDCLANMQGAHDVSTLTLSCKITERASCQAIDRDK